MRWGETMKKLLFITPELPYPAQSGGKLKSLKLLQALSKQYEITIACPLKNDDVQHVDDFQKIDLCMSYLHEQVNVPRSLANLVQSYLKRVPLNIVRTLSNLLKTKIASVIDQYDIVFLDHYEVFTYLPKSFSGLTIYHAHNAYFKMWERYSELPGNPAIRIAAYMEAQRVRSYEANVANSVDMTFAAPNDAVELERAGVCSSKLFNTYHLGDDTQLMLPDLEYSETQEKLMYVGFLGWEPNAQGLMWFIDQVWPCLKKWHPNLHFDVVGKNADERLKNKIAECDGIDLKGYVPDLEEIYRHSRVSVAPLLFGSGMKVKVLDAMARGIPTVTTSVGAEGINIDQGTHLLVADAPEEMAKNISKLLVDQQLWDHLQQSSRQLIREHYTWDKLFAQMYQNINSQYQSKMTSDTNLFDKAVQHVV